MPRLLLPLALAATALAACAPADPGLRPDFPGLPAAAAAGVDDDVDHTTTTLTGAGGVALFAQRWRPREAPVRGLVVLHHGLADHSARYAALAARLARAGFVVWAHDMRGHGRSAGRRVSVDRVDDLLDDLDAVMTAARADAPGVPVILYGHSLGGLVATLYTIERQPALAGLVLAAPALAFDAPLPQAAALRVFGVIAPDLPVLPPEHGAFSHDPAVVAEMDADPLIAQGKGPARTARSALDGVARIWAAPDRLTAPLLALHGTADTLTAPAGSRDLVARAGGDDRTLRLYDGLAHDLLREPDGAGARVADEVVAWIDAHAGGPAVALPSTPAPARLRGDPRRRALTIELDARGERLRPDAGPDAGPGAGPDAGEDALGATAGLRVRLGIGRAGAAGLGYLGGLDLRGGALDGGAYLADAHLLGLGLRRGAALLGVTAGVGITGARGARELRAPVELSAAIPVGPVRLLARAGLAFALDGDGGGAVAGAAEASALLGVRIGRDRHYFGALTAGAGPLLAITVRDLGDARSVGLALGLELWGGD
jgi:alpha-beta hydrolase superfamily lysophospholipase